MKFDDGKPTFSDKLDVERSGFPDLQGLGLPVEIHKGPERVLQVT
jgi:hypothetical protein